MQRYSIINGVKIPTKVINDISSRYSISEGDTILLLSSFYMNPESGLKGSMRTAGGVSRETGLSIDKVWEILDDPLFKIREVVLGREIYELNEEAIRKLDQKPPQDCKINIPFNRF